MDMLYISDEILRESLREVTIKDLAVLFDKLEIDRADLDAAMGKAQTLRDCSGTLSIPTPRDLASFLRLLRRWQAIPTNR